jgi:hypothetical protein
VACGAGGAAAAPPTTSPVQQSSPLVPLQLACVLPPQQCRRCDDSRLRVCRHSGCTPTKGDSFVGFLSSKSNTHLEAVGVQAAGVLECMRRLLVVHQLVVRTAHLATHPRCSTGASPSSSLNCSTASVSAGAQLSHVHTLLQAAGRLQEHTVAKPRCVLRVQAHVAADCALGLRHQGSHLCCAARGALAGRPPVRPDTGTG